ncbi:LOW QUALITY PROTEIN: hypothetical protein RJ639_033131 [Escallonia herrerae]|uniref:Major facilitator superfamily (MFS) profile domain-containing protein n=1 Tax=Escallonia herrerae TaxID=1293975 RepID=A0AA88WSL9_9ASTE|nr:LOW QUALITY PROTEIN: hypothetical protein RJ639_033131 [Escallonia herrerae]
MEVHISKASLRNNLLSVPLYLSEMAPPSYRGALNIGFQFCVGFGVLLANLINYGTQKIKGGWGWRISLAMAASPASILTLGALFLPETPNSLIQRSDNHERPSECWNASEAQVMSKQNLTTSSKLVKFPKPPNTHLRTSHKGNIGLNLSCHLRYRSFSRTIGLGESASLMSAVVTGLVKTSSISLTFLIIKLAENVCLQWGNPNVRVTNFGWRNLGSQARGSRRSKQRVCTSSYNLDLHIRCGFWSVMGSVRMVGSKRNISTRNMINRAKHNGGSGTFLAMLCHFKAGIFFFFGGWVAVMTVFMHLFLPETKNVPLELMDRVWMEHWFWKRFVVEEHEVTKTEGA